MDRRFGYALTSDGASIGQDVKPLAHRIDREIPPGREKSLALTKLEEVMQWIDAAVARAAADEVGR
ncbi:hypothetical protein ABW16_01665 [Mycolicibacter heraklionensis]|uniref:Acb2/Tad1 hairpin domain-containing protein n=1 Tax=Mycolicibacter heraklionensis TaxID=512402 RepID=A0ABR5FLI2_9MYCO|nr:hypothetical protein ABW16_01665 [Mycolicibacter heraklionensis]